MAKLKYMALAILGTLMLMVNPAMAQDLPSPASIQNLFGTDFGDSYSSILLHQMFGPLFPSADGGDVTTVFSSIIGYFNVVVLVIGGMMFFYNVTVGILQSAHEGQVLGQRWSSLWAPLRVLFAVGLLVPIPGYGGYNLAQIGVAYVVKGSTNIASEIWKASATLILSGDTPIAASQARLDPNLIQTLYLNASCMNVINYRNQILGNGQRVTYGDPILVSRVTDGVTRHYFTATSTVIGGRPNPGVCGSWRTPDVPNYLHRVVTEAGPDSAAASEVLRLFAEGHRDIILNAIARLEGVASETSHPAAPIRSDIFDTNLEPNLITAEIRDIVVESNELLSALMDSLKARALAADGHGSTRSALLDRIVGGSVCSDSGRNSAQCYGEGWIGAGSYYTIMARINAELASLSAAQSEATGSTYIDQASARANRGSVGRFFMGSDPSAEEASRLFSRYEESFRQSVIPLSALGFAMTPSEIRSSTAEVSNAASDISDEGSRMLRWALSSITDAVSSVQNFMMQVFDPSRRGGDPMEGLITIGNTLITVGAVILAASMVGVRVAVVMVPFFSVLFAAGVSLSYVLPLMPFFYWVLGVSGYFLLITEAIIAVNLWALAHMRMDGDGISGAAGQKGWLMLLSLLVTPVLMIFGFLVGMSLFRVVSDLISAGMFYAVAGISGTYNPIVALVGIGAFSIMIVVAYIFLVERSFSLVSEFPNRVMNWMGENVNIGGGEDRIRAAAAATGIAANSFGNQLERPFNPQQTPGKTPEDAGTSSAQRGFRGVTRAIGQRFGNRFGKG